MFMNHFYECVLFILIALLYSSRSSQAVQTFRCDFRCKTLQYTYTSTVFWESTNRRCSNDVFILKLLWPSADLFETTSTVGQCWRDYIPPNSLGSNPVLHRTNGRMVDFLTTVKVLTISECQRLQELNLIGNCSFNSPKKSQINWPGNRWIRFSSTRYLFVCFYTRRFRFRAYTASESSFCALEPVEVLAAILHCSFQTCAKIDFNFRHFTINRFASMKPLCHSWYYIYRCIALVMEEINYLYLYLYITTIIDTSYHVYVCVWILYILCTVCKKCKYILYCILDIPFLGSRLY